METPAADGCVAELARLRRRLQRERSAREQAEAIAEKGLRELYLQRESLRLLEQIATAANQMISVRDALQFAIMRTCEFVGWPVGQAWLREANSEPARLQPMTIWHAADPVHMEPFRRASEQTPMASGIGLPGRILASGEPAWLPDVTHDENFPRMRAARECGLKAGCGFPVLVGREVGAVLEFYAERTLAPDAAILRLMSQIGVQLGRVLERKRAEDQLIHDASHDPLTRLPNRALFRDRLNQAFARHQRNGDARYAVLFIDLDRFKLANDSLGHQAGDSLLIEVAARLQASVRKHDMAARPGADPGPDRSVEATGGTTTLARLGGDEFTILVTDIGDTTDAVRVADRIHDALRLPFVIEGQEVYTTASIGIAVGTDVHDSADEVLRDADLAMYRAKSLGKVRTELYDRTMHAAAMQRLRLESDLRRALQRQEFVLHYQPIVALDTGEVTGFEALLRWQKPGVGLIPPADFIRVAEETGLIVFLGLWVLRQACRTIRRWQREVPRQPPLTISVNVSARQFAQPEFVAQVRRVLAETGTDPATVRLEITESVTMGDPERAVEILSHLKELGVRLSLDDFGTGYSSLSYLQRFPLDELKIDRSFVAAMSDGAGGVQIIRAAMTLARALGMGVIAEGAETAAQVARLRELGCDYGQGYFFARPLDAEQAGRLLRGDAVAARLAVPA